MSRNYEDRILRVINYMYSAPPDQLSLDNLADVAAMSRFHWHRVYRAMTGETCAQSVRRMRLHRAAQWLVQSNRTIPDIAAACGYHSVPSFTRAFRTAYGIPPGQFRNAGTMRLPPIHSKTGDTAMFDVDIITAPDRRLAAISHTGPYHEIGRVFETVGALCASRNLWPQALQMLGIFYDDPDNSDESSLRSDAAVSLTEAAEIAEPFRELQMAGGKTARLLFKGPYAGLKSGYDYLYGTWLPASGETPRDAPCYEVYLNDPSNTAPADLETEICVPLE